MRALTTAGLAAIACLLADAAGAQPASFARLACEGEVSGVPYAGTVEAELWPSAAGGGGDEPAEPLEYPELLFSGEIARLPGVVRLFGDLASARARDLRFEVYLGPHGEGVGSIWPTGRRGAELLMRLALEPAGFRLIPDSAAPGRFDCRLAPGS